MDAEKIGRLICQLRKEKGLTQQQLAEILNVSDKAVSKWERGCGSPDISSMPTISNFFGISLDSLLSGELDINEETGGNMKKLKFYICPVCQNVITADKELSISCCGKLISAKELKKAEEIDKLTVEKIENDYYITSEHEMTKEHYITFVAFLNGDTLIMKKLFPEWNLQVRIQNIGHGILLWNCNQSGIHYQLI